MRAAVATNTDPLEGLPRGQTQLDALCVLGRGDIPSLVLCTNPPPSIENLADLQDLLGLAFFDPTETGGNADGKNPGFVLTGHSSSLVARGVSAINPRAIVFSPPLADLDPQFVAMAFSRGDPYVEIAAFDPTADGGKGATNFYLVRFNLPCEDTGCQPEDLLTPDIETGWTDWTIYSDDDLGNTTLDCKSCHQPGGPSTPKLLRMQERTDPWTHYFKATRVGGAALLADFHAAHGNDEDYGPIPASLIDKSDPHILERWVEGNGSNDQPNEFPSEIVEEEVRASNRMQPGMNVPPGASMTWESLFQSAASGESIAVPYHDVKVTDPAKLAAKTTAYVATMTGSATDPMPDIRDVFLDAALSDLGFAPRAGLDGRAMAVAMCGQCHNPRLDQTLSRARFDVTKLDTMDAAERDLAALRLMLPDGDRRHMPPTRYKMPLSDAQRTAIANAIRAPK
jgi:cytochrome c553